MLVGAMFDRVDPVTMNRAIVNGVLSDFQINRKRPDALAVLSLVRLLGMYAVDRIEDNEHIGILEQDSFEDFNASDNSRSYDALRLAMDITRQKLGYERADFVARIQALLSHFADDDDDTPVDLAERDFVEIEHFLSTLSEALTEPR